MKKERIRILCVDDEKNVLKSIERLFMDDDYEVLSVSSGEEGLKILRGAAPVQIVISDYRMPGMNGVDFLRAVYEQWPETVRIVLSGYADTAAVVAAINEGQIYKFIPKPWNEDELKIAVANAVERHFLQKKNRELTEELRKSNEELRSLNEYFEKLVEERVSGLLIQNSILLCSQNILDSLPVGVLGIDSDGLIVLSNRKCNELLMNDEAGILGMDRRDALAPEINTAIEGVIRKEKVPCRVTLGELAASVKGVSVTYPDGRDGVVLVLDKEDKID